MDLYTRVTSQTEFPYIVCIQNRNIRKESLSVGVLIEAHLVLATCSIFKDHVESTAFEEEDRFNDFRVMASDNVLIFRLESEVPFKPQVRFIENVHLHPECNVRTELIGKQNMSVWKYDLSIVRLTFAFNLKSRIPTVEILRFSSFWPEILDQLSKDSAKCIVVGWGRTVYSTKTVPVLAYQPSSVLLASEVRLRSLQYCEQFCRDNLMLCSLNTTDRGNLFCADRTQRAFSLQTISFNHFPCTGVEGSPLICRGSDNTTNVYGILNYLPDLSCEVKRPLVFSRIDDVSNFVDSILASSKQDKTNGRTFILFILLFSTYYSSNYFVLN